jgi:hypothetical protein
LTTQERVMEAAKLRLRFHMNNRLRLESLAALSRVFREHQEPVGDELLASLVLAVPEELLGEMDASNGSGETASMSGVPKSNVGVPKSNVGVPKSGVGVPKSGVGVPK